MAYYLLTGSTGFLGRYLMKDCLQAEVSLAVLIRPSKRETTRQRLEAVMAHWEGRLGHSLPRPVILEGDVREAQCGLDGRSLRWLTQNCRAIIHSAASMNFHASQPQGEPFHTNVVGTSNLLAVCKATGIRHFHQVSTAYICGLRTGRVLESELDLGQSLGNDYERSKIAAEKQIREANFLDSATFYRPASVIGDSQSGYTTNFHGFYAPLNVLYSMAKGLLTLGEMGRQLIHDAFYRTKFMDRLNLTGHEGKNLVPVDWVSAVTTHVLLHPELHGKTYHLTPRARVTVQLVRDVFEQVLREYANIPEDTKAPASNEFAAESEASEQMFQEQMNVYNSHWRDDPFFDDTNTRTAAPHLPCPTVDREMLLRTSRFSVNTNFGWPRPQPVSWQFDAEEYLRPLISAADLASGEPSAAPRIGLQVTGPGGGQWNVSVQDTVPVSARVGLAPECLANFYLTSETFSSLTRRQRTVEQAIHSGSLVIEGSRASDPRLADILRAVVSAGQL